MCSIEIPRRPVSRPSAWMSALLGLGIGILTPLSPGYAAPSVMVAAGGGTEGEVGDTSSWSYKLYRKLVLSGDHNGDGKIKVVILSTNVETTWLPSYFVWLGATEAVNVKVSSKADANNSALVGTVASADVVFLKGGDQGLYYDYWNGTLLETHIRTAVDTNGGAIGGTSAGAMSLAQFCFSGGQDLISLDVLQDAKTPYLDDTNGGSGIHTDFLGFVPGTVIDTHYTTRGRTGRMLGILGRAVQDNNNKNIVAIGLEEQTGIAITGSVAEVIGRGSVDFVQQTSTTVLRRDSKRPLFYTNLRLDRLTEGWKYNLSTRLPDTTNRPSGALAVAYGGDSSANSSSLTIKGTRYSDEERFARTIDYDPYPYTTAAGTSSPYVRNSLGLTDAQNSDYRGDVHESLFRALYDYPAYTTFLVAAPGQLYRSSSTPDEIQFQRNSSQLAVEAATLVIDGKTVTYKSLSPYVSLQDTGNGSLRAAGMINARIHVLAESGSSTRGARYNTRTHAVVGGPTP